VVVGRCTHFGIEDLYLAAYFGADLCCAAECEGEDGLFCHLYDDLMFVYLNELKEVSILFNR
jgi:hypothetical protein